MFLQNKKMKNINEILVNVRVGNDMYQRRGGWNYFKIGVNFQNFLLTNKIISIPQFIKNSLIRFIIQIVMPNKCRAFFYQKIARK